MELSVLQKGNIYFFYRPKVQHLFAHTIDEVQGLLLVFKPVDLNKYIIVRVGKKKLPEDSPYFAFVEKVCSSLEDLKEAFKEEHYETSTQENKDVGAAQCVGEGKYLFLDHEQHTHLCFQLTNMAAASDLPKEFHLTPSGDYLISVKNPQKSSTAGLPSQEKATYPLGLQNNFGDYRFIPLNSPEYLNYEGAEFLIIGKNTSDIESESSEIQKCLQEVAADKLNQSFEEIENPDKAIVKVLSDN
ncbi:hypothetical protein [Candidatus Odyssella thessalonicensis]|uniref:hypothetical protein n=1 Tax=Candidatus Odyssella thessalonicensis TaxID=84647 RepID=UPI000225BEBA|nr:hypothetical protein [Candidatus Odyssella thessalonicensis]